jgi:deoxyribose-phosphate aldolase
VNAATMNRESLEQLVRVVSEELYRSLQNPAPGEIRPASACPWCAQSCGGRCSAEVDRLVEAGASRLSAVAPDTSIRKSIASLIDHTLLKPNAVYEEIREVCEEARQFGFVSVCINPSLVPLAARFLAGSCVKVCTVVGFPLGATLPEVKAFEAEASILNGAQEIDMVINIGALKSKDFGVVEGDIRLVAGICHSRQAICKVIIETAYLTDDEKISACSLAKAGGADFVKTSTGFGPGGASAKDVALMRGVVGGDVGVKASGGIRDLKTLQEMVESGATRIGASASVKILQEAETQRLEPSSIRVSSSDSQTRNSPY